MVTDENSIISSDRTNDMSGEIRYTIYSMTNAVCVWTEKRVYFCRREHESGYKSREIPHHREIVSLPRLLYHPSYLDITMDEVMRGAACTAFLCVSLME